MRYWWASQGKNYRDAIPQGTLWTRPSVSGAEPLNRRLIKELEVDDVVFHYGEGHLRAVSRVVAPWVAADRPDGYPFGPRETEANIDGWLARVKPFFVGQSLHWREVAAIVRHGEQGPFTRAGVPQEKYLSEMRSEEGQALLAAMGVQALELALAGGPHEDWASADGVTDAQGFTRVRREQSALRAHLLAGAAEARCGLCGEMFPADLLVAAHIVPRSTLDDEDRRRFREIAILACLIGCDALHEHGYTAVGLNGLIMRGAKAAPDGGPLARLVDERVGQVAPGWNVDTAAMFARHAQGMATSGDGSPGRKA